MKVQKLILGLCTLAILGSFNFKEGSTFGGIAKAIIKSPKGGIRQVEVDTECVWKTEAEAKKYLFGTMKQVILQDERVAKITYEISSCN